MRSPKGTYTAAALTIGILTITVGCSSHSSASSSAIAAKGSLGVPLATSVTTSTDSWVTVPMGHLDDPDNTFWEEFTLPAGADKWVERTPPDVADNGGLVTAPTTAGAVLGFRPSQLLSFSPLAATTDGGATYVPGLLSGGLASVPDALSVAPSGQAVALTATQVLSSAASLSGWQSVATVAAIGASSAGKTCGVEQVTAVMMTDTNLFLGLACSSPGVVGLLERSGSSFISADVSLPAADAKASVEVLRVVPYDQGIGALLGVRNGSTTGYVAAWNSGSTAWTLSPPLSAPGTLSSTAVAAGGGFAVLTTDSAGALHAADIAQGDSGWTQLPTPPPGTATLCVSSSRTDALVIDSATFTDYRLTAGQWVKAQTVQVAIPYGSSG